MTRPADQPTFGDALRYTWREIQRARAMRKLGQALKIWPAYTHADRLFLTELAAAVAKGGQTFEPTWAARNAKFRKPRQ